MFSTIPRRMSIIFVDAIGCPPLSGPRAPSDRTTVNRFSIKPRGAGQARVARRRGGRRWPPSQTRRGNTMFARTLPASLLLLAAAVLAADPAAADGPKDNIPDDVRPIPPKGAEVPEAALKELRAGLAELRAA